MYIEHSTVLYTVRTSPCALYCTLQWTECNDDAAALGHTVQCTVCCKDTLVTAVRYTLYTRDKITETDHSFKYATFSTASSFEYSTVHVQLADEYLQG